MSPRAIGGVKSSKNVIMFNERNEERRKSRSGSMGDVGWWIIMVFIFIKK